MTILPSGLEELIGDSELLARFITQSGHYVQSKDHVKHTAFLPDKRDDETSVFRIEGLDTQEISRVGSANVPSGHFHGAAVVRATCARRHKLEVSSAEPPDRHGVFRNWPIDIDAEEQRARRMNIAQQIAADSTFIPRVQ